jgi:hypothetical protein
MRPLLAAARATAVAAAAHVRRSTAASAAVAPVAHAPRCWVHLPPNPRVDVQLRTATWDFQLSAPAHWQPVARAIDVEASPTDTLLAPAPACDITDGGGCADPAAPFPDRALHVREDDLDDPEHHGSLGEMRHLAAWGGVPLADVLAPVNPGRYGADSLVPPAGTLAAHLLLRQGGTAGGGGDGSLRYVLSVDDTAARRRTHFVFEAPRSCFRGCWVAAGRGMLSSLVLRHHGAAYLPQWALTLPRQWDPLAHAPRETLSVRAGTAPAPAPEASAAVAAAAAAAAMAADRADAGAGGRYAARAAGMGV